MGYVRQTPLDHRSVNAIMHLAPDSGREIFVMSADLAIFLSHVILPVHPLQVESAMAKEGVMMAYWDLALAPATLGGLDLHVKNLVLASMMNLAVLTSPQIPCKSSTLQFLWRNSMR